MIPGGLSSSPYFGMTAVAPSQTDDEFSSVSLLIDCSGADGSTNILDKSPSPKILTSYGGAQVDTGVSILGANSLLMDGVDDYIECGDSTKYQLGAGDFTIEFGFLVDPSATGTQTVLYYGNTSGAPAPSDYAFSVVVSSGNGVTLTLQNGSVQTNFLLAGSGLSFGVEHQALVRRVSNVVEIYLNNSLKVSQAYTGTLVVPTGDVGLRVGRRYATGTFAFFKGSIGQIRITKGIARTPYLRSSPFPLSSTFPRKAVFTANQSWTIPTDNLGKIRIKMWGGAGGAKGGAGGGGGFAKGDFVITPGETMLIAVGGGGYTGGPATNGGGSASNGGGGGGYSAVFANNIASQANALIMAGGGGGGGNGGGYVGGGGGGTNGLTGAGSGSGGGATQSAGGASGGSALTGASTGAFGTGGGGGGYYGGGVGASLTSGGGGSGFIKSDATNKLLLAGASGGAAAGTSDPDWVSPKGMASGNPGYVVIYY